MQCGERLLDCWSTRIPALVASRIPRNNAQPDHGRWAIHSLTSDSKAMSNHQPLVLFRWRYAVRQTELANAFQHTKQCTESCPDSWVRICTRVARLESCKAPATAVRGISMKQRGQRARQRAWRKRNANRSGPGRILVGGRRNSEKSAEQHQVASRKGAARMPRI